LLSVCSSHELRQLHTVRYHSDEHGLSQIEDKITLTLHRPAPLQVLDSQGRVILDSLLEGHRNEWAFKGN
jgi:hypothetical protein